MRAIGKIVNVGFGCFFLAVILLSAIDLTKCVFEAVGLLAVMILPVMAVALFICTRLVRLEELFRRRFGDDEGKYQRAFVCLALALLAVQLLFGILSDFEPINDLKYISQIAANYVQNGTSDLYSGVVEQHQHYLAVYPNNHMLVLIIAACYKTTYVLTGHISNLLPTLLNIAALNLSYVFMCKCARLVYKPEKALVCAIRGLMFVPLITYAPFFYTDSLCMPFVTAAAYLYIKWLKREESEKGYLTLISCALLLAVGYKIKGSAVILLIAIFVDMIIKQRGFKRKLLPAGTMFLSFIAASVLICHTATAVLGLSEEELYKYKFPVIHWVMMSADGNGGYNPKDFFFTNAVDGYDNKVVADKERLLQKVEEQGAVGFVGHLRKKLTYTWKDGTYMSGYYHKNSRLMSGNFFRVLAETLHFTLLIMMLKGYIGSIREENDELSQPFFLKICHMGLLAFLLIWEARCRYLVSFFLLFALI